MPIRDHLAGSVRGLLPLLLGAAGLLLLAACANVANLMLARGSSRAREFAVRQALGAGRGRLIRQMLAESLLLATAGGALGLLLANWSLRVIATLRPLDVAGADAIALDGRVAAIALGLSVLAAVLAGITPAWQLSRPGAATMLREGASSAAARRVRGALVIVEVCLALLLAVGAGLLIRSLREIQRVDPGFAKSQVLALQVFAWDRNDTPQKRASFFEQALERMRAQPGVAAAGAVSAMPFIEANINIRSAIAIDGKPASVPGDDALIYTTVVAGDYFRAMTHSARARPAPRSPPIGPRRRKVAVISRSAARKFWPGADPLGAQVTIRFSGQPFQAEVVGIVGDARHDALDRPGRPEMFLAASAGAVRLDDLRRAPGAGLADDDADAEAAGVGDRSAAGVLSHGHARRARVAHAGRPAFQRGPADRLRRRRAAAGRGRPLRRDELFDQPAIAGVRRPRRARRRARRDILSMVVGEGLRLALAGIAAGSGRRDSG